MSDGKPTMAFVIPCYNEQEVLPSSNKEISSLLLRLIDEKRVSEDSCIFYVDDGSSDETWSLIESLSKESKHVRGIKLSANSGHQNALLAGMLHARTEVDCIVSMDADLQDDINIVPKMLDEYVKGCQIVYGVRSTRGNDSLFKRSTAKWFYSLCQKLGIAIKPNHADFRLVGKQALEALSKFEESNLFLRGIFPLLGFKSTDIFYERKARLYGESKYTLFKMLSFATKGITSFSIAPLRLAGLLGLCALVPTLILSMLALVKALQGQSVPGWSSLMLTTLFLGSVQLICIAILGEYIGKVFVEIKKRPRFIIEKKV